LQGYEQLKEVQAQVDKVTKAVDTLRTAENKRKEALTERQKLEKRLADLRKEEAQDLANLRAQILAENKALRDNAKASLETFNGYKALTKATNEAQAEFKKLSAELGINSKEAQEAYKQFIKLDDQLREINNAARDGRKGCRQVHASN
jgi:aspartyl-tRNA synthetase